MARRTKVSLVDRLLSAMTTNADLLMYAVGAVVAAAKVTSRVQASLDDVRAMTKDDKSPVTVADLASQAVIARMLAAHDPKLILVGEEDAASLRRDDHAAHRNATLAAARLAMPEMTEAELLDAIDLGNAKADNTGFWTLDPIDGTKGFLRGQQYAIALAYIVDGQPVVAVMGCPNLSSDPAVLEATPLGNGCVFTATAEHHTRCLPLDSALAATDVRCEPGARPLVVCGSVESAHSNTGWTGRTLAALASSGTPVGAGLALDSQTKYATVARGQADAYLRLPSRPGYVEAIWDHAAGALIAQQAGAVVTDIDGKPLDFSTGERLERNRGIVCASSSAHAAIIEAIAQEAPDRATQRGS